MEFMKLIITLISCEDLTRPNTNRPIKKNAMAIIRTPTTDRVFSTTLDKNNGSYPHWNEAFRVEMPRNESWFEVEIRGGMETVIGVAHIPVSDFINNLMPIGYLNVLSYRLRSQHDGGFIRGIVNISVRVIPDQCVISSSKDKSVSSGQPLTQGFGVGDGSGLPDHMGTGVVTGIPVFSYGMNKM